MVYARANMQDVDDAIIGMGAERRMADRDELRELQARIDALSRRLIA